MSKAKRTARDSIVALLVALAPFAFEQFATGSDIVAAITAVVMVLLALVYRYVDAQVIETARDVADVDGDGDVADDLKPVLRRVGQFIRRRVPRQ